MNARSAPLPKGAMQWSFAMIGVVWVLGYCGVRPVAQAAPGTGSGGKIDDEILKVINEETRLNFLAGRSIDLNVTVPFEKSVTFLNSNALFISSGQVAGGMMKRETFLARAPAALKARRDEVAKVFGDKLGEAEELVKKPQFHAEVFLEILTNALGKMGASTGDARTQLADRLQLLFNDDVQRRNAQFSHQQPPPERDQAWLDHLVEQTEAGMFKQLTHAEQLEIIRVWPICFPKGEFPRPDPAKLASVVVEEVRPAVGPPSAPGNVPPIKPVGGPVNPGPVGAQPPAIDPQNTGRAQPQAGKVDDEILKVVNEETRLNFLAKRASDLDIQPPPDKGPALLNSSELSMAATRVEQGIATREDFLSTAPARLKARWDEVEQLLGAKLPQAQALMKQPENQAELFLELLGNAVQKMNLPMDDLKARGVLGSSSGRLQVDAMHRRNAKATHRPLPPAHDQAWLDKFVIDVEARLFKALKASYQAELIRVWPIVFPDGDFKAPDLKKLGAASKK